MKKEEEGAGSAGASPDPKTGLSLEPGEYFTTYEICGFTFRIGPPRLGFRAEGDKLLCRVEMEMETLPPAGLPAPSPQGEGPSSPYLGMTGKEIQQEVNRRQSAQVEKLFDVPPHPHPSEGRP